MRKKLVPVTVKLDPIIVDLLDNLAMRRKITRSELIRYAIKKYISIE